MKRVKFQQQEREAPRQRFLLRVDFFIRFFAVSSKSSSLQSSLWAPWRFDRERIACLANVLSGFLVRSHVSHRHKQIVLWNNVKLTSRESSPWAWEPPLPSPSPPSPSPPSVGRWTLTGQLVKSKFSDLLWWRIIHEHVARTSIHEHISHTCKRAMITRVYE